MLGRPCGSAESAPSVVVRGNSVSSGDSSPRTALLMHITVPGDGTWFCSRVVITGSRGRRLYRDRSWCRPGRGRGQGERRPIRWLMDAQLCLRVDVVAADSVVPATTPLSSPCQVAHAWRCVRYHRALRKCRPRPLCRLRCGCHRARAPVDRRCSGIPVGILLLIIVISSPRLRSRQRA